MKRFKRMRFPHLGMRIIKTGIAVFICLVMNYIFSPTVALISAIASIMVIDSSLHNSMREGVAQFVGMLIGGAAAMAMLPLALATKHEWYYLLFIPLGCMASIYLALLFRRKQCATICAFVYVVVMITPFSDPRDNPYFYALTYILDTWFGVAVGLLVNRFIKPPPPRREVHVATNTYAELLTYIRERITGTEQLILLDSNLVQKQSKYQPTMAWRRRFTPRAAQVSIAVPEEYGGFHYISCVYVTWGYKINPLFLKQKDGYVTLPAELYPVTVIWPAESSSTYKFLDKLKNPAVKGATRLPDPRHPEALRKNPGAADKGV